MRKYYLGVFMSRYYFSSHIAWQIEKVNNQVYVLDRVNNLILRILIYAKEL